MNKLNGGYNSMNAYKIIVIFIFFHFFCFQSCTSVKKGKTTTDKTVLDRNIDQQNIKDILNSKSKAVYLSYDTLDPDFGTIILLDLISKKRVKIFDNYFYNSNPVFFENGDRILFSSAQEGDPRALRVIKKHPRRQLYLIDSNGDSHMTYSYNTEEETFKFTSVVWDSFRKQLYFSNRNNNVYKLQVGEALPQILYNFDNNHVIWHLELSPNKRYLAINYDNLGKFDSGIYVYDLASNEVTKDINSTHKFIQFLGWTIDNNIYYQKDSLVVFNLSSNSVKPINFKLNKDSFRIEKIFPEDQYSVILLVDKKKYNSVAKYNITTSTEIARYNFQSQKLEWLTNDGSKKSDLNIYTIQNGIID